MVKRVVIGGVASVLVVACVVAACLTLTKHDSDNSSNEVATSTKSVESMCQPTPYKQTCEKTLSAAKNVSDPKDYIKVAFEATMTEIKNALKNTEPIKKAASDPYTKDALLACEELFNLAIEDLRGSVAKIENFDFSNIKDVVDDLKTWLSAVVAYEETCSDGFTKSEYSATRDQMVKLMNTTRELSINALSMVNSFGEMITQTTGLTRKLLSNSDSFVEASNRKLLQISAAKPNVVVSASGGGQYKTIQEALNVVPNNNPTPFIILIKAGTYKEHIEIEKYMPNVVFIGEGPTKTIITGDRGVKNGGGYVTWHTSSLGVSGEGFVIRDIGLENTAGPEKEQAVALRINADKAIVYNCKIDGFQDTLYAHSARQFYRDCIITGTIDFMFGDASAVFQNCQLIVRKPSDKQACVVTAQGRQELNSFGGFVIQNCDIKPEPGFPSTTKVYLGRPWKKYSKTIIMQSNIDAFIDPTGWTPWNSTDFGLHTCFYAEYQNRGPGAALDKRVSTWRGYQKGISGDAINEYTADKFINTQKPWLPRFDIPYDAGMMKDVVDDLKTWISAVVAYEETCLDGFTKSEYSATRDQMVKLMNTTRELSINALSMVNSFGEMITQTTGLTRKLLSNSDSFVEANNRKLLQISAAKPNVVVSASGGGQYKTIQEALNAVPKNNPTPFIILIKAGTYKEHIEIEKSMQNVVFIGEGPTKTIITGDRGVKNGGGYVTWHTSALGVSGEGFVIRDIGLENTAGPEKEQVVAMRINADKAIVYNCKIDGFQGTLYAHSYRQFYRDYIITGTIDFVFGDASAVFQNCQIIVRKPGDKQACVVTAQGRMKPTGIGGFVIQNCDIKPEPGFPSTSKAYLGRPWKEYSRTIIMQSNIDAFIDPTGWAPWNSTDFGLHTCFYAEYQNRGPGAALDKRVSTWRGYQKGISGDGINKYTADKFINTQQSWLPRFDIPYDAGMMKV
ncbi:hypothetical protein RDI58_001445 [Solanum bulbocastanum]|uniref:pectinesterase n=1 Tax=Solanum bulbocastanum TaxID=147425 RepID=A0AAN8UED4_SOLBU